MLAVNKFDYHFKVVLVGDPKVGKTNLLLRFVKNEFFANTSSKIGVDYDYRNLVVNSKIVRAYVWDAAGQDKFRSIVSAYYHGAAVAVLVYDITNYESFENIKLWMNAMRRYVDLGELVMVLLGNKSDLADKRSVPTEEAQKFATDNSMAFFETSAMTSANVEKAFTDALSDAFNKYLKRQNNSLVLARSSKSNFITETIKLCKQYKDESNLFKQLNCF